MWNLDAYLERTGYSGPVEPSLDALGALHEAHLAAIPFENLDILLGKPILLELEALERKLVADRRGGYCFEQNTLFRAALEAIGFRVDALAARVRAGATVVRPRTHMLLRVEAEGRGFLADVGFGGDGATLPLPLDVGPELWVGAAGHRLKREGEGFVLEGNLQGTWTELYAFTLEPQHPADFEMANWFTSTYPRSPFVSSLTAQRIQGERRAVLRNRDLTVIDGGGRRAATVRDPEHLLEILDQDFGLVFPAGTRFSKPDF
jgi:N-hydroxyarylamine O-acetyltransferase